VKYLSAKQLLLIHSMIVSRTGGSHGVRDMHALLTLEKLPRQAFGGKELYSEIFQKAALYARNIIMSHPFIDGNKRTGMTVASVFLENNGHKILAKQGEIENIAIEIVTKKRDIHFIAKWLKNHSRKQL